MNHLREEGKKGGVSVFFQPVMSQLTSMMWFVNRTPPPHTAHFLLSVWHHTVWHQTMMSQRLLHRSRDQYLSNGHQVFLSCERLWRHKVTHPLQNNPEIQAVSGKVPIILSPLGRLSCCRFILRSCFYFRWRKWKWNEMKWNAGHFIPHDFFFFVGVCALEKGKCIRGSGELCVSIDLDVKTFVYFCACYVYYTNRVLL